MRNVIKALKARICGDDGTISGACARVLHMVVILQQILVLVLVHASGEADFALRHHWSFSPVGFGVGTKVWAYQPFHICSGFLDTTGHLVSDDVNGVSGVLPTVYLQRAIVLISRPLDVHNTNGR